MYQDYHYAIFLLSVAADNQKPVSQKLMQMKGQSLNDTQVNLPL